MEDLQPYTQSELTREIATHPRVISRAIRDQSIVIPTGEEVPLKIFFLKPRKKPLSDEEIRKILKEKYNLFLSRRSVAAYRKELKISSS